MGINGVAIIEPGMVSIEPLYWVNFALVLVVSIVAFFVKRLVSSIDSVEKKVQELDKTVGILLDRDRRQRIKDYATEGDFNT